MSFATDRLQIGGFVARGFEAVRDVFVRNFTDDIEVGASVSAVVKGVTVVDLWGGFRDRQCTKVWDENTLVNVYSTSKGIASAAVAIAVEEGLFDYERKIKDYWPEFAAYGKGELTVGQVLSHQAGVAGLRERLTVQDLYNFERMAKALAAAEPLWPLGTGAGYHAITWGYLPGELIRRTSGKTLGQYFREKVALPLHADCFIGMPQSEMHRVADMIGPNHARKQPDATAPAEVTALFPYALQNPVIRPWQDVSSDPWRAAEIAAANAQTNGRAIARIYGAFANQGVLGNARVVSPAAIRASTQLEWGDAPDLVLGRPLRRARGFILNTEKQYGPNDEAYGHSGAGGSIGFADPVTGLGFGYAMNQMQPGLEADTRGSRLVKAVYGCIRG